MANIVKKSIACLMFLATGNVVFGQTEHATTFKKSEAKTNFEAYVEPEAKLLEGWKAELIKPVLYSNIATLTADGKGVKVRGQVKLAEEFTVKFNELGPKGMTYAFVGGKGKIMPTTEFDKIPYPKCKLELSNIAPCFGTDCVIDPLTGKTIAGTQELTHEVVTEHYIPKLQEDIQQTFLMNTKSNQPANWYTSVGTDQGAARSFVFRLTAKAKTESGRILDSEARVFCSVRKAIPNDESDPFPRNERVQDMANVIREVMGGELRLFRYTKK